MTRLLLACFIILSLNTYGQKNFNLELLAQVPHPIESNDIWGYVDKDGHEYAVIGTDLDCRIYDLADPRAPSLIATIPGSQSIWRDYKSYKNYIYQITQRGADGLTIIDMSMAPDSVSSVLFKPSLTIDGETEVLETCHNLYIDEKRGLAYLAGCNPGRGGVIIFDIATDPLNPIFLGAVDQRYSHDVVTRGDTLFSSEINEGNLGIYDISDKANPVLISRTRTSSSFTHNAWYSDDGRYVFTTDERPNAFVDAYDLSDITSPLRLDQYRPHEDLGIIPHNTNYLDGYLVTSWYTEGVIILDAHRPDNLVKVAQYDTYDGPRVGFEGNWGAYPFLPSGLVLASDLAGGLFVFAPVYQRASYLEGDIADKATGSPINGATVVILDAENTTELSKANGIIKTGTAQAGAYDVIVSHPDFITDTVQVMLQAGEVTDISIRLTRKGSVFTVVGQVVDEAGDIIPNAKLILEGGSRMEEAATNQDGFYRALVIEDTYDIYVAAWGYKGRRVTRSVTQPMIAPITLEAGYEDDFFVDLGWEVSGDARTGAWQRVIPTPTFFQGNPANPTEDVDDDLNDYCYLTDNNASSVGAGDVDDGTAILTSPPIDVSGFKNPIIEVSTWFFNDGGESAPNDNMTVYLVSGAQRALISTIEDDIVLSGRWSDPPITIEVDEYYKRAKEVRLQIEISDQPDSGHLVEGGIDKFRMYEGPIPDYPEDQQEIEVTIAPNPNDGHFYVDIFTNQMIESLKVYDYTGRLVAILTGDTDEINLPDLPQGTYLLDVLFESGVLTRQTFQKL